MLSGDLDAQFWGLIAPKSKRFEKKGKNFEFWCFFGQDSRYMGGVSPDMPCIKQKT